jgi:hypothetical protein
MELTAIEQPAALEQVPRDSNEGRITVLIQEAQFVIARCRAVITSRANIPAGVIFRINFYIDIINRVFQAAQYQWFPMCVIQYNYVPKLAQKIGKYKVRLGQI